MHLISKIVLFKNLFVSILHCGFLIFGAVEMTLELTLEKTMELTLEMMFETLFVS